MSVLIAKVSSREQINSVQRLLEVYMLINQIKFYSADITVLAYYCLFGIQRATDNQIRKNYFTNLNPVKAQKRIYNIRMKLKKFGLIKQDPYTLLNSVSDELQGVFQDPTRLGAILNFDFQETEPAPEPLV